MPLAPIVHTDGRGRGHAAGAPRNAAGSPFHKGDVQQETRIMARKYGRKASEKVEKAMHEMKRGKLRSGRSGKKVKSRKQAVAIGLSQARRAGGKVPRRAGGARRRRA
jgi:hypothetical protein